MKELDINMKIRTLLERKAPTKVKVAQELGVSRSTLASWGNNTYPKIDDLYKLANIYGVDMSYFFDKQILPHQNILGDGNVAINGNSANINLDKDALIDSLKMIIEEKERTIQILLKQAKNKK